MLQYVTFSEASTISISFWLTLLPYIKPLIYCNKTEFPWRMGASVLLWFTLMLQALALPITAKQWTPTSTHFYDFKVLFLYLSFHAFAFAIYIFHFLSKWSLHMSVYWVRNVDATIIYFILDANYSTERWIIRLKPVIKNMLYTISNVYYFECLFYFKCLHQ